MPQPLEKLGRPLWLNTLLANWAIPLVIAAMVPVGMFVQNRDYVDPYFARIIMLIGLNVIFAVSLQLINGISGQFSLGHAGFVAVGAYLSAYPAKTYSNSLNDPLAVLLFYVALAIVVAILAGVCFVIIRLIRASRRAHRSLPAVLAMLLLIWIGADIAVGNTGDTVPAFTIWTRFFTAIGGLFDYLTTHWAMHTGGLAAAIPQAIARPLTFVLLLIGGGLCAAGAGLLVGLPTLRLRGDYLAIATLGFAEIIRVLITQSRPLGGATGLTAIPRYTDFAWLYGCLIVTVIVVWRTAHSAKGRAIEAVREDEIAAAAIGIDTTHCKVLPFVVGAGFAGIGGALYAHYDAYLTPNSFSIIRSIELVVIVTLAGSGSITGTIVTAAVLTYLQEQLRSFADLRMVIYSALLIVMMLLRPQGLLGRRELWWTKRRPTYSPETAPPAFAEERG